MYIAGNTHVLFLNYILKKTKLKKKSLLSEII